MKFIFLFFIILTIDSFAQNYGGGGDASCSVGPRKVWCRDLHTTPSTDREIEINGCNASCPEKQRPICMSGYLTGSYCSDPVEPSQCFCSQ